MPSQWQLGTSLASSYSSNALIHPCYTSITNLISKYPSSILPSNYILALPLHICLPLICLPPITRLPSHYTRPPITHLSSHYTRVYDPLRMNVTKSVREYHQGYGWSSPSQSVTVTKSVRATVTKPEWQSPNRSVTVTKSVNYSHQVSQRLSPSLWVPTRLMSRQDNHEDIDNVGNWSSL